MNSATHKISAEDELLRVGVQTWRTQLIGFALITLTVAWALNLHAQAHALWIWVALLWIFFAAQCYLFLRLDQMPLSAPIPFKWWCATLTVSTNVGILWGSLAWWLPAESSTEQQLLAGFFSAMIALGSASSSNSRKLLLATVAPALVLIPSAMFWHAHTSVAALVSLLMMLLILQRGMGLQKIRIDAIQLRREAAALTEKLRVEQARAQEAVSKQAVLHERQRMMSDMHDGLGSALMSTLVAVEQGDISQTAVAEALRDCISDLRLVIDSLEPLGHDLELLLATIRHRLDHKLQMSGLKLHWQIDDLPKLTWMESPQALQVMRIIQEILTNIIKHAHATEIRITAHEENTPWPNHSGSGSYAIIVIADNGIGFDTQRSYPGRGLKHLLTRSQKLGIELTINSVINVGTQITLGLPTR